MNRIERILLVACQECSPAIGDDRCTRIVVTSKVKLISLGTAGEREAKCENKRPEVAAHAATPATRTFSPACAINQSVACWALDAAAKMARESALSTRSHD